MKSLLLILCIAWTQIIFGQTNYFPPINGTWETTDPNSLGWCMDELQPLYQYLDTTNSKGFIVLKDGKIVLEKYFGNFTQDSSWYWASAGKSLTAFAVGIAQQKGLLSIDNPVSNYLGDGWTSCTKAQEEKITVRHLLMMSSGLDDNTSNPFCNEPSCLTYKAEPGTRWAYNTGVYSLLIKIIEKITGQDYNLFISKNIGIPTGMKGLWISAQGELYITKVQTMARFGLLILNHGVWANNDILQDSNYFQAMVNTSQPMNQAYGFLWWLNGKQTFMVPGLPIQLPGSLVPNAPQDAYFAMGKYGQIICIVPSQNLVVIRMGDDPGNNEQLVSPIYLDKIFTYLNKIICNPASVQSSKKVESVVIYPNPVINSIIWANPNNLSIKTIEFYNAHGQLLQTIQPKRQFADVSSFKPGTYIALFKDQNHVLIGQSQFIKI
jgi:CubicO group peptidase (beta-lactamase class C family)